MIYLVFAVVVAVVGGTIVALRHRQPKGMDSSIDEFERGRRALAPEQFDPGAPPRRSRPGRG